MIILFLYHTGEPHSRLLSTVFSAWQTLGAIFMVEEGTATVSPYFPGIYYLLGEMLLFQLNVTFWTFFSLSQQPESDFLPTTQLKLVLLYSAVFVSAQH